MMQKYQMECQHFPIVNVNLLYRLISSCKLQPVKHVFVNMINGNSRYKMYMVSSTVS